MHVYCQFAVLIYATKQLLAYLIFNILWLFEAVKAFLRFIFILL